MHSKKITRMQYISISSKGISEMKKILSLLLIFTILVLIFVGCTSNTKESKVITSVTNVEFVLDGKYGVKDLAYGLSYSDVCKALGLDEKSTNERDIVNEMEEDGVKAEYKAYVKPDQKYDGKNAELTLQFCDDELYGLSYSLSDLTEEDYEAMLDKLKSEFGEPEVNSYDVVNVWEKDNTKLTLSKMTGDDYISVQIGVLDVTKTFNYMVENK